MQFRIAKRQFIVAALCLGASLSAVNRATAQTPIKFSIDWTFQGVHAPFAVAIQKGYYKREGLDVTMDRGAGSGDTIARVAAGTYDIGYGDSNLLVKFNHDHPDSGGHRGVHGLQQHAGRRRHVDKERYSRAEGSRWQKYRLARWRCGAAIVSGIRQDGGH